MIKETTSELYRAVRAQTMRLVAPLEIEDYVIQTATFMSPPRWHLGHTTWFFEMLLKEYQPGYQIYREDFLYYFNSYYEKFGMRIERAKRGTKSRPTVRETLAYRNAIDESMLKFLSEAESSPRAQEALRLVRLGLEHEMQHQELLVYDIKHLLCDLYPAPQTEPVRAYDRVEGMAEIEGGLYTLGYGGDDFSFDNEKPAHKVYLQDYAIDRRLVTNGEFLEFIAAGGYREPQYWYAEAWDTVNREKWQAPLYWERQGECWMIRDYHGLYSVREKSDLPVAHVSYYEAAAYAKWTGKRLPTEAEWEKASCYDAKKGINRRFPWGAAAADSTRANLLEGGRWDATPAGAFPQGVSPYGCHQMIGDLWEWTSSDYAPFPGFKSEFDEYTDKWFVSQKVLRGGSYGTPQIHIRTTYRNYFYPQERWLLCGFRCASTR